MKTKLNFRQKLCIVTLTAFSFLAIIGGFSLYNSINLWLEQKKLDEKLSSSSKPFFIEIAPVEFTYKLQLEKQGKIEKEEQLQEQKLEIKNAVLEQNQIISGYAKEIYNNRSYVKKIPEIKNVSTNIEIWSWKGGKTLNQDKMRNTIKNVLSRLTYLPQSEDMVNLILETAAAESDFGYAVKQYNGVAESVFQIEPETWKFCEETLKKVSIRSWQQLRVFYNKKDSEEFNMINNIPYSIARCATVYYIKCGKQLPDLITTKEDRALLHKAVYNTVKGKSTVEKYISMVDKHL